MSDRVTTTPGSYRDIPAYARFLIDLEFVMERGRDGFTCVFTHTPSYAQDLADCFPNMHFMGYCGSGREYDPCAPREEDVRISGNLRVTSDPFTRELAEQFGRAGHPLLLVSYRDVWERQVTLHCLARPISSLMLVASETDGLLEGDLILPLFGDRSRHMVFLAATQPAKGRECKDPTLLAQELTYFNLFTRASSQYDETAKAHIVQKYATCLSGSRGIPPQWLANDLNLRCAGICD